MKRCRAACLAAAALGFFSVAHATGAAEPQAPPLPVQPENAPPPSRPVPGDAPVAAPINDEAAPRLEEAELKIRFKLLSSLAQEHRQRAETATKGGQAQKAKWETDLAEELGKRGSDLLVQLEGVAVSKQPPAGASPAEPPSPLSPAETEYLAKIQERLQAVQQEIAAATAEATAYALEAATNRDTVVYGDTSTSLRFQEVARDIKRLRAEQAGLELKTSEFWALRAMIRGAQNSPPPQTNGLP